MQIDKKVRLQKYIAECGICSRRKAEELILHNKIMVNNNVVNELGFKVDPFCDEVLVYGNIIKPEKKLVYIALNKPKGYITSAKDQFNRPTVMDLVSEVSKRIYPVGRLDYDTSGLIILTNDGELANKIMHPKHKIDKKYIAEVKGDPLPEQLDKLKKGIKIADYTTSPAKVVIINKKADSTTIEITIHEGKNRQIRKMFETIGHPVINLKRVSVGIINLGSLKLGKWRNLNKSEIEYLMNL